MQLLTLENAATIPGHALRSAEERNLAAHAEDCCSVGVNFIPLILESLGGWGQNLIDIVKAIGHLQAQCLGSLSSKAIHAPSDTKNQFLFEEEMPSFGLPTSIRILPLLTAFCEELLFR